MRMSVTMAGADSARHTHVSIVTLTDGRRGFAAPRDWSDQHATVTLTDEATSVTGPAQVVRSGPAYEEVRARLRVDAGRLGRWRLRRDAPVVLVSMD